MLDFLNRVADKVRSFFERTFDNVTTFMDRAASHVWYYVDNLKDSLSDYRNLRQAVLLFYHNVTKAKDDDIIVNNYGATRYTAVESFTDVWMYRNAFKNAVKEYAESLVPRVRELAVHSYSKLRLLFLGTEENIGYLATTGAQEMRDYATNKKPGLISLLSAKLRLLFVSQDTIFGRINNLTGGLFVKLYDYALKKYIPLNLLDLKLEQFKSVVSAPLFDRLQDIAITRYNGFVRVILKQPRIDALTTDDMTTKINYVMQQRFNKLHSILERSDDSILSLVADIFMDWFLDRVWEWLLENEE